MSGLRLAVSLLTRIPVGGGAAASAQLARAVPWFPVVGALVGLAIACVFALGLRVWPPYLSSVVALTAGLLLTGAFHEDGLADTVDAFGGGWTTEDTARILKDPTHGTFGVLAIVVAFLLRTAAVATLTGSLALVALPAAHALSRAGAVTLIGLVPSVGDGLGAGYASDTSRRAVFAGAAVGVVIAAACLSLLAAAATAGVALTVIVFARLSKRKLEGISGDVLGATQQVGEIAVLLVVVGAQ